MNENKEQEKRFDLEKMSPEEKGMVDNFMKELFTIVIQAETKKK